MTKLTFKKSLDWIMSIIAVIMAIAIGGLFINGTFLNVILLSYLPVIIHQIVGWTLIAGTIIGVILKAMK